VAALTGANDPLVGREPVVECEDLSMDDIDEYLHGCGEESVCLGDPGLSVGEWTMSMSIVKNENGQRMMREVLELAKGFEERCDQAALVELGGFQLHRRMPQGAGMELALSVEFEGWSGWVMLEWLIRKVNAPLATPLRLARANDRGRLASFLDEISLGIGRCPVTAVLEKSAVRAR